MHLSRILSNITDNATKFSPPGSAITVWSSEEQLDGEHTLVTFVCRDQGIGMSEEFSAHAFDMFTQEKVTSRSTYQGTGLGLAKPLDEAKMINALKQCIAERSAVKLRNDL